MAGGDSSEKVISLKSARVVCEHLNKSVYYSAVLVHLNKEKWQVEIDDGFYEINKNNFSYKDQDGKDIKFDAAFIAIHGTPGEDGKLQGYFDLIGLPYTGAGVLNSSLTFNKWQCNAVLKHLGYNCSASYLLREELFNNSGYEELTKKISFPCFVKPNNSGSSFGISKVKSETELKSAIEQAFSYASEVMVEKLMTGREVTCGMLNYKNEVLAFPLTEIISKSEFFDYKAKYEGNSEEITPARISEEQTIEVQETAKNIYRDLGLKGLARIDFMLQKDGIYVIEVNTVPGLTTESLIPQQAKAAGFSLTELFSACIEECLDKSKNAKIKK